MYEELHSFLNLCNDCICIAFILISDLTTYKNFLFVFYFIYQYCKICYYNAAVVFANVVYAWLHWKGLVYHMEILGSANGIAFWGSRALKC